MGRPRRARSSPCDHARADLSALRRDPYRCRHDHEQHLYLAVPRSALRRSGLLADREAHPRTDRCEPESAVPAIGLIVGVRPQAKSLGVQVSGYLAHAVSGQPGGEKWFCPVLLRNDMPEFMAAWSMMFRSEPLGLLQPGYVGVAQRRPEAVVGQEPRFEIHHRVSGACDGPSGGPDHDFRLFVSLRVTRCALRVRPATGRGAP
jgi:hypothetical protein